MGGFLTDFWQTILPPRDSPDGPLSPLLLALTMVTGLVDAFSFLVLAHVFVANMTGNVIFLGFALIGPSGFSARDSGVALVGFGVGVLIGGKIGAQVGDHRGRLLSTAAEIKAAMLGLSVLLALLSGSPVDSSHRLILLGVLSVAMGIQNAVAHKLAVPDMPTSVITRTLSGIADSRIVGGQGSRAGRRLAPIAALLLGALIGAELISRSDAIYSLVLAMLISTAVAVITIRLSASDPAWTKPRN